MITLSDFIEKWTGKTVSFPNCEPNQCMTLMHVYLEDVFGLSDPSLFANPSAYEVYTNYPQEAGSNYFNRIQNTPTGIPNPGDLVIINKDIPGVTGDNGHICIFVSGDTQQFTSFDCNFPTGSLPHLQHHTYDGVLGWLTAKAQGTFVDTTTFEQLVAKATAFDAFVTSGYNSPQDVHQKLQSCTDQITALQKTNGELVSEVEALQVEVKSTKDQMAKLADITQQQASSDSTAIEQGLNSTQALKDVTYDINLVAEDLHTTYPPIRNIRGEIQTLKNNLLAAQIELTKRANENEALKRTQLTAQAVKTVGKGLFSSLHVWLVKHGVLDK